MTFELIEAEKAHYPVGTLCRVLGASRSGYYAWCGRQISRREHENRRLLRQIAVIHRRSRGTYGSPRVWRALRAAGHRVGRHRVARLMRGGGIRGVMPRRYRVTTESRHDLPVAPNLLAGEFSAQRSDAVWAGDITYLRTHQGWLYLAVLLDLYSRRVVGWSMSQRLDTDLPLAALRMALGHRRPGHRSLHHSDRGCQYASRRYRAVAQTNGLRLSMSRRGNCWDNAPVESFFATLKKELAYRSHWATRREARADVYDYIEVFYNRQRMHSALGYLNPVEFENRAAMNTAAS